MADRVGFSKEEYKEKKIRIYMTFEGMFQSNFTEDTDFESDIDCLAQAKYNIDTGNIKIKKKKRDAKGRRKSGGYILIECPEHPFAYASGHVLEHRFVLENYLRKHEPDHPALIEINGIKYLNPKWCVYHLNDNKYDNRHGNLIAKEKDREWCKSGGYIFIKRPEHPFAYVSGYVPEHRLVLEKHLRKHEPNHPALIEINGVKYLSPDWDVHHWNERKNDNRPENLEATVRGVHNSLHKISELAKHLKKTGKSGKELFKKRDLR